MSQPTYEELAERVAWLEDELGLRVDADEIQYLKDAFGITPNQARLLRMLYRAQGRTVTHYQLDEALAPSERGEGREAENVPVYIVKLRQRFGKADLLNVWGQGYRLSATGLLRVAEVLSAARRGVAA